MTASAPLDQVWNYPLFEALYRRRSRRFGLGFEMPEGPFRYKSAHAPVPLSELEEALLLGAGAGFSGLAFWDLPTPPAYPHPRLGGRTFPTTRPGGHTTLFWTNDDGLHVLDDKVEVTKLREVGTEEDRGKLVDIYRAQRRTLGRGRLDIPRRLLPMSGHDLWDSNQPGSTLFLPVCDVSAALISLIAQFVDPALRRYAPEGGGMNKTARRKFVSDTSALCICRRRPMWRQVPSSIQTVSTDSAATIQNSVLPIRPIQSRSARLLPRSTPRPAHSRAISCPIFGTGFIFFRWRRCRRSVD